MFDVIAVHFRSFLREMTKAFQGERDERITIAACRRLCSSLCRKYARKLLAFFTKFDNWKGSDSLLVFIHEYSYHLLTHFAQKKAKKRTAKR